MERFHRALLAGNRRPAEALRLAQQSVRAERRWSSPYYWAGFTLVGEWK
jgi:CHAT domain-containing protein